MSADLRYSVEVAYFSSGRIDPGLNQIHRAKSASDEWLKSLHSGARSATSAFNGAFDSVASTLVSGITAAAATAGAAGAAVLGTAIKEGLGLNQYTEDLTNGIASTFAMLGDIPLDAGLKQATRSAENLRRLALKLPGEYKDAANAFGYVLPVGIGHGVETSRLEDMAALSVAAASALGINPMTVGHEQAAMLEGRSSGRMPLFAKMFGGEMSAKEFNALSFEKRFTAIEEKYKKLGPSMDLFASSWSGLTSAAKDQARNVAKTFAEPLFQSVKRELGRGLEWFGTNEDAVHAFARRLGNGVDRAFHRGLIWAQHWTPIAVTFGRNLYAGVDRTARRLEPLLTRLSTVAERFMTDPAAFDKIAHTATMLLALRAGSGMLGLGLDGTKGIGSLVSALGSAGGSGGLAAGLAAVGPAALAGAAAVGALALGAYGAVGALTDTSSAFHDVAAMQAEHIATQTAETVDAFGRFTNAIKPVTDAIGVVFLTQVDLLTWEISAVTNQFAAAAEGIRKIAGIFETYAIRFGYLDGPLFDPKAKVGGPHDDALWRDPDDRDDDHRKIKPPVNNTTINNKIEIKVEGNPDPNRVASAVYEKIEKEVMRKSLNPMAPVYR